MQIDINKIREQYKSICVSTDLEGVLIDNWDDFNILYKNKELVKEWVSLDNDGVGGIFSNAVDNFSDKNKLSKHLSYLETNFDVLLHILPVVIARMVDENFKGSMYEYKQQGKRECYLQYVAYSLKYNIIHDLYVLLDDQVENELARYGSYDVLFVNVPV